MERSAPDVAAPRPSPQSGTQERPVGARHTSRLPGVRGARADTWASALTFLIPTRAIVWVLLTGIGHLLILWFVTSGPVTVAFCGNCTAGHLASAADVVYYFDDTSASRSREAALAEYPPLAKAVLMAPRLLATQQNRYVRAFELEMWVCDLLTALAIALWSAATAGAAAVPRRLAWYTVYVAVLSPLVYTRFDLVPAVLAFAAAIAWGSGRPAVGALASALGLLTKLFPGCVAAVGFVHECIDQRRTRLRGTAVFAAAVPALTALSWPFGGHTLFSSYLDRRLQLESAFAGIVMVVGRLARLPMTTHSSHHAIELGMRGTQLLAALTLPLQGALLGGVLYAVWRARAADFVRHTAAAILALVVPAKVLSPQYLIWLIPFVSVLEVDAAPRVRWFFLAACIATTVIFPFRYADLAHFEWWAIGVLNLRNALLLMLFLTLVGARPARATGGQTVAPAGRSHEEAVP